MAYNTEFEQLLQQAANNEPSLTAFSWCRADLSQDELIRLSHALVGNTHITMLNLYGNNITDEGVKILMVALAQNNTITTLNLSANGIGPEGARALAQNNTIRTLNLRNNHIGPAGANALAQNNTIRTLYLSTNGIGPEGARALAQNNTITILDLGGNNIGAEGVSALAQNCTITTLHLHDNHIGSEGAKALAQNCTITALYLHNNHIGPEGASALAQNNIITTLELHNNHIGPEGASALAQNNTIRTLNLRHNHIGPAGANALAQNNTITTLCLGGNNIGNEVAIALAQNNTIGTLNLVGNNIGNEGAIALVQNCTLTTLHLHDNNLDNENDASALLEALKKNTSLVHFDFDSNSRTSAIIRAAIQKELNINQACRQVLKEHIQTLMKLRTLEPTNPLAVMPIELMFLFFKELMPGFNPHTFMQMAFSPADEETLTKARNKLTAIAEQQGLFIRLEPAPSSTSSAVPTCPPIRVQTPATSGSDNKKTKKPRTAHQALRPAPLPTHFYAVTEQTLLAPEGKTVFSPAEQRQLLQPASRCFLYSCAKRAREKLTSMTKNAGFFRATTPLLFRVSTEPLEDFNEGRPVECRQLNTIMNYRQDASLEHTELLQAHQDAQQIKQWVAQAYQAYETASMPSTATSSTEVAYIDNTRQLGQTYAPTELALAAAFKNSLNDLAYPELIQILKAYAAGLNGEGESNLSFMASLYQQFIQHYGTPAQKDNLPSTIIHKEALLEAIAQMEQVIKQHALQGFNPEVPLPTPRSPQRAMG